MSNISQYEDHLMKNKEQFMMTLCIGKEFILMNHYIYFLSKVQDLKNIYLSCYNSRIIMHTS